MLAVNESLVVIIGPFVVCKVVGDLAEICLYVYFKFTLELLFYVKPKLDRRSGDAYCRNSIC